MRQQHSFRIVLSEAGSDPADQLELFSLLNLGLTQSLASGVLSPSDALHRFYHAENCLYVRKHLRNKDANAIMSRGVQLSDLFEISKRKRRNASFFTNLRRYARCV